LDDNHPTPLKNRLLAALPKDEFARLNRHLTPFRLGLGETIYKPEEKIKYVYFVVTGVVSHVTHLEDGGSIEVGLIGNDGMVGLPMVLGDDVSPDHAFVQMAGQAWRMDTNILADEIRRGGEFQRLLLRFVLAMNRQVAQTAACNGSHTVSHRLARWLLICHDRVDGDELHLTQEFIADMLGTRRSGVSQAAILLQAAGAITYKRGRIRILDRPKLEDLSCECYAVVRAEYDRLLGAN
jgi:CRP-like cAMP-binding protein